MINYVLGFMLHVANSSPPTSPNRVLFYAMKQRILLMFGERDGYDVQFITKKCWGLYPHGFCTRDTDCKCGGSGVFDFFWVKLERWKLGPFTFHNPIDRRRANTWGKVTIEGYIEHKKFSNFCANECQLWLALIFSWPLFRELFFNRPGMPCRWDLPPLVFLSKLIYLARRSSAWRYFDEKDDIPF